MVISRSARSLVGSVLAVALTVGPASSVVAAPQQTRAEPRPEAKAPEGDAEPEDEPAQADESSEGETPAAEPSEGGGETPAAEPSEGETPAAESSEGEGETPAAESSEGEGETPGAEAQPSTAEAPATEPAVTVRPGAVSTSATGKPVPELPPPREAVVDPRRLRSDEKVLLRASAVSFGVAGLATVPLVLGLHQAAEARRELDSLASGSGARRSELEDRERTMNRLALAGGIVAGVQLVTGAVLLGVGLRKPRPRRHAFAPAAGPGSLGVVWRGRF